MFGVSRGRPAGGALVPIAAPDAPGTLATNHEHGLDAGSGMVPAGTPFTTDPNQGGRVDDLGLHVVVTNPQGVTDLAPIRGVDTRPMVGGLRTAHHTGLLHDPVPYDGRHVELVNRVSVVVLAPHEQMMPAPADTLPSLRVPQPSDPYGRACANAAAAARGAK